MSKAVDFVGEIIGQMETLTLRSRAMDEAPVGITIADMREDDEPIVYVNDGFLALTGYSESSVLGENCRFLQGEETAEEPVAEMRRAIENDESVQVELRNYREDGELFWNQVTLAPLRDKGGEVTHYVGFQQDITTQKTYERQLEDQREDLRVLNEMVRHDIRNDLQVALAALEVLEVSNEASGRDTEQIRTALNSIHQAIDLTNTARDIAEVMLETKPTYIAMSLGTVLDEEIRQCRDTNPDAIIEVAGTIPQVEVEANDLLGSVFRNLLTNAVTHNDAPRPEVLVTATTTDETVRVTIADNGPGVPDDARDRLFERGWKGNKSSGTGIGLYIVRSLVESYGGSVELREDSSGSRLDELGGATFVVELPLAE